MALEVEEGSGKAEAETYISVEDADDYIDRWHDSTDWGELESSEKERALRRATRYVDSHRFRGWKSYHEQALAWPRAGVGWVDGREVLTTDIPQAIKSATIEAALRDAQGEDLMPDHDGATVESEERSVGPLSKRTSYATPKATGAKRFEAIRALLRPYLWSSSGLSRSIA